MTFTFRPAIRENVGLLIGLIGGTGSGKTWTAMTLATGLAGGKRFCVIDTEARRALHYADQFQFDHGELSPPFRPSAYADAIKAADEAGYPVIVVDSYSHEHAGEGGLLDFHEEELHRMAGDDWKKREACKMAAWIRPKLAHKQMVQRLLQVRAHLVLCFRAEQKVEMIRGSDGKMQIVQKQSLSGAEGWIPVCEKSLPYELTTSILLIADKPGVPHPIKLQEQHKPYFPLSQPIGLETGQRLAAWAAGRASKPTITEAQQRELGALAKAHHMADTDLLRQWLFETYSAASFREIASDHFEAIKARLKNPVTLSADLVAPPTVDEPEPGSRG